MAEVVLVDHPGMTQELYDKVTEILGPALPEGCQAHIAGPGPNGWRVITVWDSMEVAGAYIQGTLNPVFEEAGVPPLPGPPASWPLHRLVS